MDDYLLSPSFKVSGFYFEKNPYDNELFFAGAKRKCAYCEAVESDEVILKEREYKLFGKIRKEIICQYCLEQEILYEE